MAGSIARHPDASREVKPGVPSRVGRTAFSFACPVEAAHTGGKPNLRGAWAMSETLGYFRGQNLSMMGSEILRPWRPNDSVGRPIFARSSSARIGKTPAEGPATNRGLRYGQGRSFRRLQGFSPAAMRFRLFASCSSLSRFRMARQASREPAVLKFPVVRPPVVRPPVIRGIQNI